MNKPFIIASATDFKPAVTLGQGLPAERNGQPCAYFWKEALPLGNYVDARGKAFEVTPARIDKLILNFNRAKEKGFLPSAPSKHEQNGASNFGFIIDARKSDKGSLELLHQQIGDDAIKAVSRNSSSICIVPDVKLQDGTVIDELIDHNAVLPNPQLTTLSDFQPVLVASSGATETATVFLLAADPLLEKSMDLTKLREVIGAGKEITDEQLITQAIAKIGEGKTAIALSGTQATNITTLNARVEKAEAKVLELSRTPTAPTAPDPEMLADRADLTIGKIELSMKLGEMPPSFAKKLADVVKPEKGKPNVFMLSRNADLDARPVDWLLNLFKGEKFGVAAGSETNVQTLSREIPGETKDKGEADPDYIKKRAAAIS